MKYLLYGALGVLTSVLILQGWLFLHQEDKGVGAALFTFQSLQLAEDPDNGECLTTDGTDNIWSTSCGGGGGASSTIITFNDGSQENTGVPTLDFSTTFFNVTESPADEFNILGIQDNQIASNTLKVSNWTNKYVLMASTTATGGFDWVATSTLGITGGGAGHDAVTLAGQDYLTLSTQQITANKLNPDDLASADFGDFTCNGTNCSLDATYLTGNETITLSGDVTGSGATAITTAIANDVVAFTDVAYSITLAGNPALGASESYFGTNGIIFEGSTANTAEALLTVTNPTADRTFTFPDDSITVAGLSSAMTGTFDGNNFGGGAIGTNEMLYGSAAGTFGEISAGTSGQLLQANGSGVPVFVSMSGDATIAAGGALTIAANAIEESMLKAVDTAADEECLTYETTTGDFEWQDCGSGGGGGSLSTTTEKIMAGAASTVSYLTDEFMLGGSSSTTAEFLFDYASSTLEIRGGSATTSIYSSGAQEAVILGEADQNSDDGWTLVTGIEWVFKSATAVLRGVGTTAVTTISTALNWTFTGTVNLTSATVNFGAGAIDALTEIASGLKSGADATLITGTAGTNGNIPQWNGDGDLVDASIAASNVGLANGDTWTGAHDFSGASLEIPNGTNPTTDAAGEIALDTTDNQLIVDDGTNDMIYRGEDVLFKFTLASTSPEFKSGGVLPIPPEKDGFNISQYRCYVDGGTSVVVNVSDGTNDTETITCATTLTSDTDVATNDSFTAGELAEIQIGTITGTPDYLSFTAYGFWTRE